MGFRYRKSINLGGGFRINISKSGIGYSWGVKGYRVTKLASGGTRTTLSVPGTGLSWVENENKKRVNNDSIKKDKSEKDKSYAYSIENASADEIVSAKEQDFIDAIKRYIKINNGLTILTIVIGIVCIFVAVNATTVAGIVMFLIFLAALIYKIIYATKYKVEADYEYDDFGGKRIEIVKHLINILQSNNKLWQINDVYTNERTRVHGGATQSLVRCGIKIINETPPFLKTNAECYFAKLKKEKIYILPDKIIIINGNKIGAIDFSDLRIKCERTRFLEKIAPPDAEIVGETWQYVNKNGTPDKRFKNNYKLWECRYGEISFMAGSGLNVLLQCSNIKKVDEFNNVLKKLLNRKITVLEKNN